MSPISSETVTPLDCFATATKLIIDASRIDPRCASILPKVAVAFANVAKDPQSKAVSLGTNMSSSTIYPESHPPPTANTYLVEAIRVVSCAAPFFGSQVTDLVPVIISAMSPAAGPSGFASAEVGAETSMVSGKLQQPNNNPPTVSEASLELSTPPMEIKIPSSSTPKSFNEKKKMSSSKATTPLEEKKMPSKRSMTLEEAKHSIEEDCSHEDSSFHTLSKGSEVIITSSTDAMIDRNKSDGLSTTHSHSSSACDGKRKGRAEREEIKVPDRIPKRQKIPFVFRGRMLAPTNSNQEKQYESRTMPQNMGLRFWALTRDEERTFSSSQEGLNNTPLKVLQERHAKWQKVLSYMPVGRCIPTETYLVVAITSTGSADALFPPERYKEAQNLKDKDLEAFLSIKKIIMIPRPLNHRFMYYCIPNLHKWVHGSLQLNTSQESYFKEATVHIKDIVYLESGRDFSDRDLGIEIRYQDRMPWNTPILRDLIPYVSNAMDTSTSVGRPVPCLSSGWNVTNAHEYKNNRINILGSISPFLSDGGFSSLEQCDRDKIIDLVCHVNRTFSPYGIHPFPFYHSDPGIMEMRRKFALQFLKNLGCTSHPDDEIYFRTEGIHFVFTNFVPFHLDTMNDNAAGMNESLAINCQCIIGHDLAEIPSVKKAMSLFHLKVGDPLSFSMVLYSRKVVGTFVKKQLRTDMVKNASSDCEKLNHLPDSWWLIKPLLTEIEQVESEANTNKIWDDPSIMKDYLSKVQCDPSSSQYRGKYISLLAGYDKMRHWSPVKYLVDVLHARQVITMDRDNVMGIICFSSFDTNGNFLLSSIIDELLLSTTPSESQFMKDYKKYGLYPALIFAAQCKNENTGPSAGYGSSLKWRSIYNKRGTCSEFPIAGGSGLLSFDDDGKDKIRDRCLYIVSELARECYKLHSNISSLDKKKRRESSRSIARDFYRKIQDIGGPGVSHEHAINFIQLSSIFGFIPFDIINWVCVGPKTSATYKAINFFYKKTFGSHDRHMLDLTEDEAYKHFTAAVEYISSNVSWNFTSAIADNILSILIAKMGSEEDKKSVPVGEDILFLYEHRKGTMNHLYRWKMDTNGKALLQFLHMRGDNSTAHITILEVNCEGSWLGTYSFGSYWADGYETGMSGGITCLATYTLSDGYRKTLL